MSYTLEILREVWDNTNGGCIEIGPDRDDLGIIEIRYKNNDGDIENRMTFLPEQARLIAQAMLACANEIEGGE